MMRAAWDRKIRAAGLRLWFGLNTEERLLVAGLLAVILVGLAARYHHLRRQQADPYRPAGLEQLRLEENHE